MHSINSRGSVDEQTIFSADEFKDQSESDEEGDEGSLDFVGEMVRVQAMQQEFNGIHGQQSSHHMKEDEQPAVPVLLFASADYSHCQPPLSQEEAESVRSRRLVSREWPTHLRAIRGKWKLAYASAEIDSRRTIITREEVAYFRWALFYEGIRAAELRHFQADGRFDSPYLGQTTWHLYTDGSFCIRGIHPLPVERLPESWGWVIGKGYSTVYFSLET